MDDPQYEKFRTKLFGTKRLVISQKMNAHNNSYVLRKAHCCTRWMFNDRPMFDDGPPYLRYELKIFRYLFVKVNMDSSSDLFFLQQI
jgi:hypothetical protein